MKIRFSFPALFLSLLLALGFTNCSNDDPIEDSEQNSGTTGDSNSGNNSENGDQNGNQGEDDQNNGSTTDSLKIIFEDDFEGPDSIPDKSKWVLCEKGDDSWNRYLSESYAQVYQKNGSLFIYGENVGGVYQTGGIETRGKFDFCYGVVECKARFVRQPQGNHTGIWMMPSPPAEKWPKSGEIDIMEHLNADNLIYETVHSWYIDDMGHKDSPKAQTTVDINKEDWNVYGVKWTPDSIVYTVNGQNCLSYPNLHLAGENGDYQWPFDHSFYLILSQSLGGEDTWAGAIDESELPAIFEIDWIKVYQ